jgi:hypothetical protein
VDERQASAMVRVHPPPARPFLSTETQGRWRKEDNEEHDTPSRLFA